MAVEEKVMDIIAKTKRDTVEGQYDLFGGDGSFSAAPEVPLPDIPEFSRRELMRQEKEITGLYLTGHPMDDYRELARSLRAAPIGQILGDFEREEGPQSYRDGQRVTLVGVVNVARTKTTKNNTLMAYVTLEDDTGAMELLVFSRVLETCASFLKEGTAMLAEGRLSVRDEKAPQVMCDKLRPLDEKEQAGQEKEGGGKLYVRVPTASDPRLRKARLAVSMFPGGQMVVLYCEDTKKRLGVLGELHPMLVQEMEELFGKENVVLK